MVGSRVVWRVLRHHKLVSPVYFKTAEVLEEVGSLHPRRPYHKRRRDEVSARQADPVGRDFADSRADSHIHADVPQQLQRGRGYLVRESGKDTRCSFEKSDPDVSIRVDAVQPVRDDFAGRAMKLGSKLGAGCPRADYGDVQLPRLYRAGLRLRPDTGVHETTVEADSLLRRLKRNSVFGDAFRPEIVRHAADRHHERVVRYAPDRRNFLSVFIIGGCEMDQFCGPVQADHLANLVIEVAPMRLREVIQLFLAWVHASRRHLVKKRLP